MARINKYGYVAAWRFCIRQGDAVNKPSSYQEPGKHVMQTG